MRMSAGMTRENMPATSLTRRHARHVLRQGPGRCPITPDPASIEPRRTRPNAVTRCTLSLDPNGTAEQSRHETNTAANGAIVQLAGLIALVTVLVTQGRGLVNHDVEPWPTRPT
jgi:hypothetical protein